MIYIPKFNVLCLNISNDQSRNLSLISESVLILQLW